MCPDPSLLVAYLDGTLFPRDAARIEEHLSGCERCAALLATMRQEREAAARSPRRWAIPALIAAVAVAAIAVWMLRSASNEATPSETTSAQSQPVPPTPVAQTPVPSPPPVQPSTAATKERERPAAVEKPKAKPAPPPKPAPRPKPALKPKVAPPPVPKPVAKPARAKVERAVVPRVQWRASDLVVERSTDGGMTWTTEYTSDRPIRATAFLNADIAWLVGANGLVLRRTKNGWFGASAPADGDLTAVRATSPSKATVTHQDGRVFTTENGGVTWSSPP